MLSSQINSAVEPKILNESYRTGSTEDTLESSTLQWDEHD